MLHREMCAELNQHGYELRLAGVVSPRYELHFRYQMNCSGYFRTNPVLIPRHYLEWHEAVRQSHQLVLRQPYYALFWAKSTPGKLNPRLFVSCKPITENTLVSRRDIYSFPSAGPIRECIGLPEQSVGDYFRLTTHCKTPEVFFSSSHLHVAAHVGRIVVEANEVNDWNVRTLTPNILHKLTLLSVAKAVK